MKHNLIQLLGNSAIAARRVTYITLGSFDKKIRKTKNMISILCYHSVEKDTWRFSIDPEMLEKQIHYLTQHFDIISLDDVKKFINKKMNIYRPSVVITFDDGYKNLLQIKPILDKYQIKPTVFLLASPERADRRELDNLKDFLTVDEIKKLQKEGWVFGCHSATHANFSNLSPYKKEKEIVVAKKDLEKKLRTKIQYFAFPKGRYTVAVLESVKDAGYTLGLTMDDGYITQGHDAFVLPRVGIDRTHSFNEFVSLFSPSNIQLRKAIKSTVLKGAL